MEEGVSACAVPTLYIIAVLLSDGLWGWQEAISTVNHLCLDAEALIDCLPCSAAGKMNWSPHRDCPRKQTHALYKIDVELDLIVRVTLAQG